MSKKSEKEELELSTVIEAEAEVADAAEVKITVRQLHYFATDGNYGDANGLALMETTHWNNVDWEIIEQASDWARPAVARVLTESYEEGADEAALRYALDKLGIDLSEYEK